MLGVIVICSAHLMVKAGDHVMRSDRCERKGRRGSQVRRGGKGSQMRARILWQAGAGVE